MKLIKAIALLTGILVAGLAFHSTFAQTVATGAHLESLMEHKETSVEQIAEMKKFQYHVNMPWQQAVTFVHYYRYCAGSL